MKLIHVFSSFLIGLCSVFAIAQESAAVPMAVYITEDSSNIPTASCNFLTTRMNAAIAKNGMGTTSDFTQFYLSCNYSVVEKHIVSGSPTKYFQTVEINFFVVDAFAQKVFTSVSVETKGVGNSEEQANTAGLRQVSSSNQSIAAFIRESNQKIIRYYDTHYKSIIDIAQTLAKVYKYEEALFRLAMIPESCCGYQEALTCASGIYKKYLDDKANKALAKATAIWNAGQDAMAASEAGEYLSEILPDASCYPQAVALSNEIKKSVKSDIDYYRKRDETAESREHSAVMATINAWKAVGVAYGNGQKSNYYKSLF